MGCPLPSIYNCELYVPKTSVSVTDKIYLSKWFDCLYTNTFCSPMRSSPVSSDILLSCVSSNKSFWVKDPCLAIVTIESFACISRKLLDMPWVARIFPVSQTPKNENFDSLHLTWYFVE